MVQGRAAPSETRYVSNLAGKVRTVESAAKGYRIPKAAFRWQAVSSGNVMSAYVGLGTAFHLNVTPLG